MSIISEALKKAQEKSNQFKKDKSGPGLTIKSASRGNIKKKWFTSLILVFISIAIFFFIIFSIISERATVDLSTKTASKDRSVVMPTEEQTSVESAQISVTPLYTEDSTPPSSNLTPKTFILTGIVSGSGGAFAVINNSVVEEGDQLGEAKVVNIEEKRVKLLFNNKEIILTLE